ncbi:FYVE zinc finger-domain-containing protein [Massariosphaeria phaeospora]|uniref:RING-type E3 ubiquitin transferase n=1 Tax=Massariosphaeria phaeospora TaxID=100035 RepID=A0A7C8IC74_9PLEO|nr:FYVE zinc finger-domain-containing protein [Massariosphaeria phaeospora]
MSVQAEAGSPPRSREGGVFPRQVDGRRGTPVQADAGSPPRSRSHGAIASHFLAQPRDAFGGQTWVDFLRESGADEPANHGTAPDAHAHPSSSSSNFALPRRPPHSSETASRSSDRKRRLTTAESPMRRPSSIRMHSSTAGASSADPIVLDSPPVSMRPPPPPSIPSERSARPQRRESDIVLPSWQPDAEVSYCPVCGSQFTWFYRKHHCRKCGRVVCTACSPHRITIPRQFIVRPPSESAAGAIVDLTEGEDANSMSAFGPFRNPALGGGEEVRVCNPCVPDPNYNPPPQYAPDPASRNTARPASITRPSFGLSHPRAHRSSQSVDEGARTIGHGQAPTTQITQAPDPFNGNRASFHNSTRVADLWPPPQAPHGQTLPSHYNHRAPPQSRPTPMFGFADETNPLGLETNPLGLDTNPNISRPPIIPSRAPSAPAPPMQIAEEDECPVCGNELPPKGPNGDESARTQHVEDCLTQHASSPQATPDQTSISLPAQRTRGMSNPSGTGNGNGEGASNRHSISARGMVVYTATEKDCSDEEGLPAECIICFEEFAAGDRMGRLVCWCKFHEECIRKWWEKKGRGACPTHQLHY